MQIRIRNPLRLYAGFLFVAFGLIGVVFAARMRFGTGAAMGPGFLPTICSWLVVTFGLLETTCALYDEVDVLEPPVPRPVFMIFLSIGLFALLIDRAGLALTVFVTAFVASYAGHARLGETLALAAVASAATTIVFATLLGLPLPVWPEVG